MFGLWGQDNVIGSLRFTTIDGKELIMILVLRSRHLNSSPPLIYDEL